MDSIKKYSLHILITVLILLQIFSAVRIGNLQSQIENLRNDSMHLHNTIRGDINSGLFNMGELLRQEASLIAFASVEIGAPNIGELTVPVKFSLTPREVGENTAISLHIGEEAFELERQGTAFMTALGFDFFADIGLPVIVIYEDGISRTTQDSRLNIHSLRGAVLPEVTARFAGSGSTSSTGISRRGTVSVEISPAVSGITFSEVRLVTMADGAVLSDEVIMDSAALNSGASVSGKVDINKNLPLREGQVYTMTVIALNSIGLEHHVVIDHDSFSFPERFNFGRTLLGRHEQIFSPDGRLLWETQ